MVTVWVAMEAWAVVWGLAGRQNKGSGVGRGRGMGSGGDWACKVGAKCE